jgi:hypothetical protein
MSVCIVGNSDNVINSNLGDKVDKCDHVIRINDFLIKDHENDVGQKTTIIACAFSGANKIISDTTWPTNRLLKDVQVWMARPLREDRISRAKNNNISIQDIACPTQLLYDTLIAEVYSKFWRKEPSSGLVTIAMAMNTFPNQKIYIHGFDNRTGKQGKRHYFDPEYFDIDTPEDPVGHDWESENMFINDLIVSGRIGRLK